MIEFGLIDILVAVTLVLSILFALYRGLVREILGITAWVLAGFGALYSYAWLQPYVHKVIENKTLASIVAGVVVSLVILVLMTILNAHITTKLRASSLSGLDRVLGIAFGLFRALLLIGVIYIGASMILSEKKLQELDEENITMPYIRETARVIQSFVPEDIQEDLKAYEQGDIKDEKVKKIGRETVKKAVEYGKSERDSLDDMIEILTRE